MGFEQVSLSSRRETPLQEGHSYLHLRGEPNPTGEGELWEAELTILLINLEGDDLND